MSEDLPEDLPGNLSGNLSADDPESLRTSGSEAARPPRVVAMDLLARREHTQAEMRQKLADRGYPPEDIEPAVAALLADGLLSDERFAEAFVAARMRKGQGPVRIRMELQKRGLDGETVRLRLEDGTLEWDELARDVRRKKFGADLPGDYKEKTRQMRFLEYRGFTSEQIRAALDEC